MSAMSACVCICGCLWVHNTETTGHLVNAYRGSFHWEQRLTGHHPGRRKHSRPLCSSTYVHYTMAAYDGMNYLQFGDVHRRDVSQ